MAVAVGTSGWQYADWRGAFYPDKLPVSRWLEHYAGVFPTVEVNNAFYRLPEEATFASWRERTPEGFVVAVKASRYLTHVKRLRDPAEPVARLLERANGLGGKLGPLLLQLPPNLHRELGALEETLACFPPGVRVAVEPRHESWFVDATAELLSDRGAALCLVDRAGLRVPQWRTADWGYVRFHAGRARPLPCYGRRALRTWAERLAELYGDAPVYAYFNNDTHACAPRDALTFTRLLQQLGVPTEGGPPPEGRARRRSA